MRSDRVFTNMTCNQNCTYCSSRSGSDPREFVRPDAVRARIDAAVKAGAREVVLTGGEPSLRRDLAALVAHARAAGAERVALETNATAIDAAVARALRDAGLALARVNLSGAGAALDAVTRDPGGAARTLTGARALLDAGVAVEISAALVRSTRALLPALPGLLARELGPAAGAGLLRGIVLAVPASAQDPGEVLSYPEGCDAILALDAAGRAAGVPVRLGDPAPPPCTLPLGPRTAHLFSLTPGGAERAGYERPAVCAACVVRDRCPGVPSAYLARFGAPEMKPVREERTRRRLSLVSSVADQVAREFAQRNVSRGPDGTAVEELIVRVNFHCNQSCRFCFVSTHLPAAGDRAVREAIAEAGARGAKLVLSGGEPTLNPQLAEYVALARSASPFPVNLQTNATRLGDRAYLDSLVRAGLGEAFVSLHGATAETSDAVTEAPGTFVDTVAGLDALAETDVRVLINFVICQRNVAELPAFVRMVAARWPRCAVNVSFVAAMTDVVPREAALVPRYTDCMPVLAEAMAEAQRLGLTMMGFESMCGIPLCLVPAGTEGFFGFTDVGEDEGRGEFVRASACGSCSLARKCFGVRRGYAELHGTGELRAVGERAEESAR